MEEQRHLFGQRSNSLRLLVVSTIVLAAVCLALLAAVIGILSSKPTTGPFAAFRYTCAVPNTTPLDPSVFGKDSEHPLYKALQLVNTTIAEYLKANEEKLPGVGVGIVYDQQVLLSSGFGKANIDTDAPVTADSLFGIGSNSKMITAVLMMKLKDMGLLELDDPISKFKPDFEMKSVFIDDATGKLSNGRQMTLRQIASHLSGLPRDAPCASFSSQCNYTSSEMIERLKNTYLIMPRDKRPSYSNLGYALLGNAITDYTSSVIGSGSDSFSDILRRIVLDPLDLHSTGVEYTEDVMKRLAVGYSNAGGTSETLVATEPPNFGWAAPSGQLYSSTNDLLRLMSSIFNTDNTTGVSALLKPDTVRELFRPMYTFSEGQSSMGMPWESVLLNLFALPFSPLANAIAKLTDKAVPLSNYWLHIKSGMVFGYLSHTLFVPELKLGIVVLQNSDLTVAGNLHIQLAQIVAPVLDQTLRKLAPKPTLPADLSRFTGQWQASGIVAEISKHAERDTLEFTIVEAPNSAFQVSFEFEYVPSTSYMFTTQATHDALVCPELQFGYLDQYVIFSEDVTSFAMPGLVFDWTFTRK